MQNINLEKVEAFKKKLNAEGTMSEPPIPTPRPDTIVIAGGELVTTANGVTYYGNNGSCITFTGVKFSTEKVLPNTAYQLNGTIHVSEKWIDNGFNVYNFAHEYGHYIQEEEMGKLDYYKMAIQSMYNLATDPENHYNMPQASELGYNYLIHNTTYPGMK